MSDVVKIGDATLYRGDCIEIMPTLDRVEAVITDPPYGIGKDGNKQSTGRHGGRKAYAFKGWDGERPPAEAFKMILDISEKQLIWGGHHFADCLPPTEKWLVWDKGQRIAQSDGELAWTSLPGALRIKTLNRVEILKDSAQHPTQKPVNLMTWCLDQLGRPQSVLDPFMGSGSTGVACAVMGVRFIGIERDEEYFDIACERIDAAYSQGRLFA